MKSVKVRLSEFTVEALAGEGGRGLRPIAERVVKAVQYYLGERGASRPEWSYPSFLRDREGEGEGTSGEDGETLELSVDEELWDELEAEADRQGVSTERLTEYAALYFAADLSAGRILEDLDASEG